MIEYAITAGEGTLLAYGLADKAYVGFGIIVLDYKPFVFLAEENEPKLTIIARLCTDDCETGK